MEISLGNMYVDIGVKTVMMQNTLICVSLALPVKSHSLPFT